jgi:hypothetical protein
MNKHLAYLTSLSRGNRGFFAFWDKVLVTEQMIG